MSVNCHGQIKLVISVSFPFLSVSLVCWRVLFFSFLEREKNFEILLLGRLCKLFDKALFVALACGALAMCLQMHWLFQ